ncbi:GNAT family N-acetyltransferase [Aquisalimonas sp.]|uniref:GNAT family N-acetyltransferase n=1 Tax=Aquisalimonas sp. TaxID=1872621 RepID=UPI0025BDCF98|nr:GNAT family N-acetyltransferase [Aquisalimonas sp.]
MTTTYRLQWLRPGDARRVAWLERHLYPRGYRAGARDVREQLAVAEAAGENLSIGLFLGRRLVGYCLMFVERDRRDICDYIGISAPPDVDLSGPGLYLADIAVHPLHRRQTWTMIGRLATAIRARRDLRGLPLEAFSDDALMGFWRSRNGVVSRVGLQFVREIPFHDPILRRPLHWLQLRQVEQAGEPAVSRDQPIKLGTEQTVMTREGPLRVGIIDRPHAWKMLAAEWHRLWHATPNANVFCSFPFLRAWWQELGLGVSLLLVVVMNPDGGVRAIAPLQIAPASGAGGGRRCLGFLGHPSEVDRPLLLAEAGDHLSPELICDYLMALRGERWSSAIFYEQDRRSPFLAAMFARLRGAALLTALPDGPECPVVDVRGDWSTYLAGRSRAQRKSLKRRLARLRETGEVRLDTVVSPEHEGNALPRYLAVERRSWKPAAAVGVARSSAHLGFLQALAGHPEPRPAMHFRFLTVDGQDVAATLGLFWCGCLYSLHIAHDRAWDPWSPGFVLTALELEDAFSRADYQRVDYLAGFLSNKRGWATEYRQTQALYAQPRNLQGYGFHLFHFHCKPWLKQRLDRVDLLQPLLRWKKHRFRRQGSYA